MIDDDIILGVRAAREEYSRLHGFNIRAMIADLQSRDGAGDQLVVRRPARRPEAIGQQLRPNHAASEKHEIKSLVAVP
jgi:hypothetical protein